MKYFELTCTAYLKRDIDFRKSFEAISRYISFAMAQIEKLREFHNQQGFKHYCFDNFYPIERDRTYKRGKSYRFSLRSLDESFINSLSTTLRENINNPNLLVVQTQKRVVKQFFITELYSVTPVIVSVENGKYWTFKQDGEILKLYKQLHDNLDKKYKDFYGKETNSPNNLIKLLEIKNQKPQTIQITKNGKPFRFFGNKFKLVPQEDEFSQKLAFIALACGLGEKNSFGGGFCIGNIKKVSK